MDFSVEPNDYLCIVGENGAGKSTLVKGLLRLKKPASGTITWETGFLAKEIGYRRSKQRDKRISRQCL
ncbi:MAG: ATP-binding cassette domain-containing protein [Ruthenibacterium lactatiformans]